MKNDWIYFNTGDYWVTTTCKIIIINEKKYFILHFSIHEEGSITIKINWIPDVCSYSVKYSSLFCKIEVTYEYYFYGSHYLIYVTFKKNRTQGPVLLVYEKIYDLHKFKKKIVITNKIFYCTVEFTFCDCGNLRFAEKC